MATKDCDQDYVRADMIEEKILNDIQAVFEDEALLQNVWEAAQAKLAATRPNLDTEIQATQEQRQKCQAALQRYFTAFEAGTMDPATCNERVAELTTQVCQLDGKLLELHREREELDLPALRTEFIHEILTNLKGLVDAVPLAQKKHLLQLLVEKVLIEDRCTFKVWYRLPQFPGGVRTLSLLVAPTSQYAKHGAVPGGSTAHAIFHISKPSTRQGAVPTEPAQIRIRPAS